MNWFDYLEQRKKLFVGGTIIICLAMLAVTVRRFNVSFDSYWHLQTGLDWLEKGLSPWIDHFSFTFHGEQVTGIPFMFEWLLAWLVMHFGLEPGFQIFKLAAFGLVFGFVVLFLRMLRAPVVVYCLVLTMLVVLLQLRSIVRPELISFSFSVIAIILYYRARSGISFSGMLPMLGLMLLWANYHSPIFGYIIFFGYFLDTALKQYRDRAPLKTWLTWSAWGLAIVAVGFLHPGFNHALISFLNFSPEWKGLIQEYQSAVMYREVAAVYTLIAIALVTSVSLFLNRQFGLLFICLFLSYFSFDMVRLVTPSGIVILCLFAWTMSEIDLETRLRRLPRGLNRVVWVSVAVFFLLALTSSIGLARSYMVENRVSGILFPGDVADYMIDHGISGRIFNTYDIGGYLIYRLSPESQVYIDGRTNILYPLDHFYRMVDAERSPEELRIEIEKYDIDLAVLLAKQSIFSVVQDSGMMALDYVGDKYALFRRDNPNFPVLGKLLAHPACWNQDLHSALENEQAKALSVLPGDSLLLPFTQFVIDYDKADDPQQFLNSLGESESWSAPKLRFAGYQALLHNLDSVAYELFAGIKNKEFSDYLAGAVAQVRLGDGRRAEQLLDVSTRVSWSERPIEIRLLHDLLLWIRENSQLDLFDDEYIDKLAADIDPGISTKEPGIPDPRLFCPGT